MHDYKSTYSGSTWPCQLQILHWSCCTSTLLHAAYLKQLIWTRWILVFTYHAWSMSTEKLTCTHWLYVHNSKCWNLAVWSLKENEPACLYLERVEHLIEQETRNWTQAARLRSLASEHGAKGLTTWLMAPFKKFIKLRVNTNCEKRMQN